MNDDRMLAVRSFSRAEIKQLIIDVCADADEVHGRDLPDRSREIVSWANAEQGDAGAITHAYLEIAHEHEVLGPIQHDGRYRVSAGMDNCTHKLP